MISVDLTKKCDNKSWK